MTHDYTEWHIYWRFKQRHEAEFIGKSGGAREKQKHKQINMNRMIQWVKALNTFKSILRSVKRVRKCRFFPHLDTRTHAFITFWLWTILNIRHSLCTGSVFEHRLLNTILRCNAYIVYAFPVRNTIRFTYKWVYLTHSQPRKNLSVGEETTRQESKKCQSIWNRILLML